MTDPTKNFPTTFFTSDRLLEFWYYVKWFMKYNMPIFMICMAVIVAGMVVNMIVDIPGNAKKEYDRSRRRDDDDDVDVKYY